MNLDLTYSDDDYGDEDDIIIHKAPDFDGMRKAGRLAAECLDFITPHVQPGVTTEKLNQLCHDFILDHKAIPAPLNYKGFPKSICTSINHVVCHGIPGDKQLEDGDILNIDVTVILDGWYGDTSRMYYAGDKIATKAKLLVDATYDAMMLGIEAVKPIIYRRLPWILSLGFAMLAIGFVILYRQGAPAAVSKAKKAR